MASRETLCCLALAVTLALAGCQASGTSETAGAEQGSWWNWGTKTAPPSTTSGSPFSAAATYNRENTSQSQMGITLYDGSAHAKPASPPPANLPGTSPGASGVPPATPGAAYPPGSPMCAGAGPNAVPGGGPPGMIGAAPSGYWVYQPANGYPAMNQNGAPLCVPVYGPPMNGNFGYGPPPMNGNPAATPNAAAFPVQAGSYPANYPAMAAGNAAVSAPANMPVTGSPPVPPNAAAGVRPINSQGYGTPASGDPQGNVTPQYAPGGFVPGSPATAGTPMLGNQGLAAPPYALPQTSGVGPTQVPPNIDPLHSADAPAPATIWSR